MRRILIAFAALLLVVGGAQAFEKTPSGGTPKGGDSSKGKPLDLSSAESSKAGQGGTEVRIPGLGSLGVLPKLDFGLELLYGEGQAQAVVPREEEQDSDGLRIRGTLKHRF